MINKATLVSMEIDGEPIHLCSDITMCNEPPVKAEHEWSNNAISGDTISFDLEFMSRVNYILTYKQAINNNLYFQWMMG